MRKPCDDRWRAAEVTAVVETDIAILIFNNSLFLFYLLFTINYFVIYAILLFTFFLYLILVYIHYINNFVTFKFNLVLYLFSFFLYFHIVLFIMTIYNSFEGLFTILFIDYTSPQKHSNSSFDFIL